MADAGIVNTNGKSDDAAFRGVVADSSEDVKALAFAVRDLMYDAFPETVEVVWPKQGSVGWGIGPKKFSEQLAYLLPFTRHVTLGFYYGGELPDPSHLLREGGSQVTGKLSMRSLKITSLDDVRRPELRELVEAAVRHITKSTATR
jgi:hypothetical protein